jgi:chromosomal replication initiator protein
MLINPRYTFDNFVVGECNRLAVAAARAVAEDPGENYNPLFIYGGSGLGKTHIMHAIGNYIRKHNRYLKVLYVSSEKFLNEFVASIRTGSVDFREKYRSVDVLMIDDIQFIKGKDRTQEELFHTFNDLYQSKKQIILTSDRPPKEIPDIEDRLRTRFEWGLIADVQPPELETRIAILQKKADQEKYSVEDEVINFIAENCDTNIREMEGMLSKVCFYASLLGKEKTTMDEVKEALKDHVSTNKQSLTADRIIDCVCKYYNISKEDLVGKKKNKEIVEPRQMCVYLINEMLNIPLTAIGALFGGRDHTTIMHARDKINSQVKVNPHIKTLVNDIKSQLLKF